MAEAIAPRGRAERADGAAAHQPPPRLRLSRRGVVVVGVLGVLLLAACLWLVLLSSVLDARAIAVTGTHELAADQVVAASGVRLGLPLARIDTDAVRETVAARLKRVDTVEVWRGWPHTLRIKVTERHAVAAVKDADGRFTQVDGSGVRFATAAAAPAGVPVVQVKPARVAQDAIAAFPQRELVAAAVQVAKDLPDAVAERVRMVEVHSYDDIELRLDGDRTVLWGSRDRGPRKAVVLTALLTRHARTFDVSAPDAPATSG